MPAQARGAENRPPVSKVAFNFANLPDFKDLISNCSVRMLTVEYNRDSVGATAVAFVVGVGKGGPGAGESNFEIAHRQLGDEFEGVPVRYEYSRACVKRHPPPEIVRALKSYSDFLNGSPWRDALANRGWKSLAVTILFAENKIAFQCNYLVWPGADLYAANILKNLPEAVEGIPIGSAKLGQYAYTTVFHTFGGELNTVSPHK